MIKKREKLIIKVLMLVMCTSLMATTMAFAEEKATKEVEINSGNKILEEVNELANSSAANESDFEFDANTGTITKYVGRDTKVVIPNTIHLIVVES